MNDKRQGLDTTRTRARLITVVAVLVTAAVMAVGAAALSTFERAVEPELNNRARLIGAIVRQEVQHALELGIPFTAIVGLELYLTETLDKFEGVDRIAVHTTGAQEIASVVSPASVSGFQGTRFGQAIAFDRVTNRLPVLEGNELVGEIVVEISPQFVQTRLMDVFLDVLVIALVATLVAMELALAVIVSSVGKPFDRLSLLLDKQCSGNFMHRIRAGGLGGLARAAERLNDHAEDLAGRMTALPAEVRKRIRAGLDATVAEGRPVRLRLADINDIRLALFLFSVATEIGAAFLPLYARAAIRPDWLSPELAAAAPLILYLLGIAVLAPFGGALARRFGPRRLFLASVPPTAFALVATALSNDILEITFWRGVMAVFYATATIACQEYAIRASVDKGSARPASAFVAVVYGGVFCGSALGGVLAERFGFEAAFMIGGAVVILAGVLALVAMRGRAGDPGGTRHIGDGPAKPGQWFGTRFFTLLMGVAVPMNAATAIFVWYLTPLILASSGSGPAEIARVVMLYYLAVALIGPAVSNLADRRLGSAGLVTIGALVSGAALLLLTAQSGFWAVLIAMSGVGIGHALMRAPLYAMAQKITGGSGAGLSALRLVERVGALLGLAASALLIGDFGTSSSIRTLGIAVLAGALLYTVVEMRAAFRSKKL